MKGKKIVRVVAPMLALAFACAAAPELFSAAAIGNDGNYKAVLDYDSLEEAQEYAADLNEELTAEGSVLLKNDGTLPLPAGSKVTLFGAAATSMQGASGSISMGEALEEDGFVVNPNVITESNYKAMSGANVRLFNGAAIVVLKRGGSEGSDLSTTSKEEATEEENVGDWQHELLAKDGTGKSMKHNLMLTDAENEVIAMAKATCKKVIVLLNTSNAMEMFNLDQDEAINAIMFMGRPGKNGVRAIGKLLKGEYNPSGKTSDEWMKDFSADPTWYNFGNNQQNAAGSSNYLLANGSQAHPSKLFGIDYEEDIYLGYKYYETVYAEIAAGNLTYKEGTLAKPDTPVTAGAETIAEADAWFADAVVYPFGYGLSYTTFEIGTPTLSKATFTAAEATSEKTMKVTVTVKNTGSVAGKETVELYSQAPYTSGGIEKAAVNLVGFAKTDLLRPGQSQKLEIEINLQDMASYDYNDVNGNGFKGYELEAGTYTLFASNTSHCVADTAKATFTVDEDTTKTATKGKTGAMLKNDDFSGEEITNLFSKENGRNYSLRKNDADWNGDGTVDAKDKIFETEEVLLSRADLVGTFPKAPAFTVNGKVVPEFSADVAYAEGDLVKVTKVGTGFTGTTTITYYKFAKAHAAGEMKPGEAYKLETPKAFDATKAYAIGDTVAVTEGEGAAATTKYYMFTAAHAAGAWTGNDADEIDITMTIGGDLTATKLFADMVKYYDEYNLDTWVADDLTKLAEFDATKEYKIGDRVKVTTGETVAYYEFTKAHAAGAWNAADAKAITKAGHYVYEDGIFQDDLGFDVAAVAASEMQGWTQMADAAAQAAAKEAAGDAWISFYDLAGIRFNDTAKITEGKFKDMTGVQVWTKFMNQWTWQDFYTAGFSGGGNGSAVANLGIPAGGAADSPLNWNSTYAWCCNTTIGSTWNYELAEREGIITANMGLLKANGKDQWMTPAVNMHRTPFSGRNNEYYSQDGYHAGWMAVAVCKGAQSRGVGCHLKHMVLNDQETNRNGQVLFVWVSEQAFREIYVKPFQMGIQEGNASGMMGAFARIGAVPASASYNMQELMVRKEFGRPDFMFHTDYYGAQSGALPVDLMLRAGTNHAPITKASTNGSTAGPSISGRWDKDYVNTDIGGTKEKPAGGVYIGKDDEATGQAKYYSNSQWYIVRRASMIMYSEYANQAHVQNGYDTDVYKNSFENTTFAVTSATDLKNVSVALTGVEFSAIRYDVTKGALPNGLTLNASNGKIEGTALAKAGNYNFTVTATLDGWIKRTAEFTINLADPDLGDKADGLTEWKVGEDVEAWVGFFDKSVGDNYSGNNSAIKSIELLVSGLPAGVTASYDAGINLEGKPTEAGTFGVTFGVKVTYAGRRNDTTVTLYTFQTITVAEGEAQPDVPAEPEVQFKVEEGYIKYTQDAGKTWTNLIAVADLKGADGAAGTAGADGKDGAAATITISEDGYWVINGTKTETLAQGPKGDKGEPGAAGADGAQGPKGDKGETGATGPQGPKGDAGEKGSGCGGSIAIGGVAMTFALAAVACAAVLLKKKKD